MKQHLALGLFGESVARNYLLEQGFYILESNWRFSRAEVDIIAREGNELVFVEVKLRTTTFYGRPESFVGAKKQRLMADAAAAYMYQEQYAGEFRFDIISIVCRSEEQYALTHFRDAFFPGL